MDEQQLSQLGQTGRKDLLVPLEITPYFTIQRHYFSEPMVFHIQHGIEFVSCEDIVE